MAHITVDFSKIIGPVKPMNSVNNGPAVTRGLGNFEAYRDAAFPFARIHDAAFSPSYGGQHAVDIINIFPDFDRDENDPASYDFDLTDEYMEDIMSAGTEVFYRLGNKIEHESKRYGSLPPKDYAKWARICEHIIRHMNEGWADGHHYGIRYWEIWNEPDLHPQCWEGENEDFFPLYDITARHLKACFPDLKIGGPAVTSVDARWFLDPFFRYMTRDPEDPTPMDFFSFHRYASDPAQYGRDARLAKEYCDKYGYGNAELILNEWNYVRHWTPKEEILYSYYANHSLKGAAFVAGSVIEAQHSPLDHFMYYDARIDTHWNGLFDFYTRGPLPPYYAMCAFRDCARLGKEALSASDDGNVRALAAVNEAGDEAAVMVSYYRDAESLDGSGTEACSLTLRLDWTGFASENGVEAEYLLLDGSHSLTPVSAETFFGAAGAHILPLPLYTTVLVKLKKRSE